MASKKAKKESKELDAKIKKSSKQMREQAASNSEAAANAGQDPGKKAGPPKLPGSVEEKTLTATHEDLGEIEITTWVAEFEGETHTNKSRAACNKWLKEKRAKYRVEHGKDLAMDKIRKMIGANKERLEKIGKSNKEYLTEEQKDLIKEAIANLDEFQTSLDF